MATISTAPRSAPAGRPIGKRRRRRTAMSTYVRTKTATTSATGGVTSGLGRRNVGRAAEEDPAREVEQADEEDGHPERAEAEEPDRAGAQILDLHPVHPGGRAVRERDDDHRDARVHGDHQRARLVAPRR